MRHKLNLPETPNIILLIIVFDLLALVMVYGLYGTNWIGQAGQIVELPTADASPLQISDKHILIKVFGAHNPQCIVGKNSIPYTELEEELVKQQEEFNIEEVLLMTEKSASVEREREVLALIQKLNLRCTLIAKPRFSSNNGK